MKVYNEEKTKILYDYDLNKGRLVQDKLFVAHHPSIPSNNGSFHYVVKKQYPNGGKDLEKVWDIKPTIGKEAYDEYEDIQVYIPYTQKELNYIEINLLKTKLLETDYKAIKYAEGQMTEEEYAPIKAERQEWRNRINYLETI